MKNKIFGFMLTLMLVVMGGVCLAYGADASLYPTNGSFTFDAESDIGKTFEVEYYLQNNSQIDSTTFYIIYDPEVVVFKSGVSVDTEESVSYPISDYNSRNFVSDSLLNSTAKIVPKSTPIYQKKPDGTKTAAQLGEIKVANVTGSYGGGGGLYQITKSGVFFKAEFEVVGEGRTEINIVGPSSLLASTIVGALSVDITPVSVYVNAAETTTVKPADEETETTTAETSSETTTKAEETTEAATASSDSSSSSGGSGGSGGSGSGNSGGGNGSYDGTTEATTAEISGGTVVVTEENKEIVEAITETGYAFTDIERTPWAADAINYLAARKIVNGYSDGTFLPNNNVTRADFIIMLMNTLGIEGEAEDNFTDVRADKYYAPYVGLAKEMGIATGYSDGTFAPEAYITRQDMMVLTARAYEAVMKEGLGSGDIAVLADFADGAEISDYAAESIAGMVETGIVNGSNGKIEPKANTTRAQTAVIMYNVFKLIEA